MNLLHCSSPDELQHLNQSTEGLELKSRSLCQMKKRYPTYKMVQTRSRYNLERKDVFPTADQIKREHFPVDPVGVGIVDRQYPETRPAHNLWGFLQNYYAISYTENLCCAFCMSQVYVGSILIKDKGFIINGNNLLYYKLYSN